MKYARLFVYTGLLAIAVFATRWKISSIQSKDSGEVVSISSIWAEKGKPVEAEIAKEMRLPKFEKLSARVISKTELKAYVPLRLKKELQLGQGVYIFEANKEKYKGELVAVSASPEEISGYYEVRARFNNAKDFIKGQHLIALVVTGFGEKEIKIKRSALSIINNEYFVWVIDKDQRAQSKKVSADVIESTFVGVIEGLKAGDKVITSGWSKLGKGDKVSIVKEGVEL